ncbi:MAG: hypothetical protein ABIT83_21620 [Massilia sp.]
MTPVKTTIATLLAVVLAYAGSAGAVITSPGKQIEKLNRGTVSIMTSTGPFISWRLLATDAAGTTFNVYKAGVKLNATPLTTLNYRDTGGSAADQYAIRPVVNGVEANGFGSGPTWTTPYRTVPVQKPADGVTPDGVAYSYELNDGAPADLDGDGTYEMVIK